MLATTGATTLIDTNVILVLLAVFVAIQQRDAIIFSLAMVGAIILALSTYIQGASAIIAAVVVGVFAVSALNSFPNLLD